MNTHREEINIALNIIENINKNDLLMHEISSLDRIIQIYFSQKRRNLNEEKQVIDFIFRCLDVRGRVCSVLFMHLSKSKERENIIKRLHEEYEGKFDFNLVNSSLFESSYQRIKKEEKMKHLFYFSAIFAFLCFIGLFFMIHRNKQKIRELNEASQINNKLEGELKITRNNLNEEVNIKNQLQEELKATKLTLKEEVKIKNKLQEELNVQNKIEDHLANFKEKIENEVKSKERIEEEIKKRQIVEEELEKVKKQLEKSMETNKELEEKLQYKEKKNNELTIVKPKFCDEQIKISDDLENQLRDMKTSQNDDDKNKSKIKDEHSKDLSEKQESNKRIAYIAVGITILFLIFFFIEKFCYPKGMKKKQKNIKESEKKLQKPESVPEKIKKSKIKRKPENS